MKRCIVCGRTNDKRRLGFVGAKCEDCEAGVLVSSHVEGRVGRKRVTVESEKCRCGVKLEDWNRYLSADGRKDRRCIECARADGRERYRVNRDKLKR